MSRLVEHEATGPRRFDESDLHPEKGDIAVCRCGLSADYPLCDGSHRDAEDEPDDALYRYVDDEGERREVARIVYANGTVEERDRDRS